MTDLSKYKAFPKDYEISKGTEVIVLSEGRNPDDRNYRQPGLKGVVITKDKWPYCDWEDGKNSIVMKSHELAPLNPQDHPDYKQEEPEWQPKTGDVVNVSEDKDEGQRVYLFTDSNGHWCVSLENEENYKSGIPFTAFCWKTISKIEPVHLKLTRAEIAEKFGTDNFEIID